MELVYLNDSTDTTIGKPHEFLDPTGRCPGNPANQLDSRFVNELFYLDPSFLTASANEPREASGAQGRW